MSDAVIATPSSVASTVDFSGELSGHEFLMTSNRAGNAEIFRIDPYTADAVNLTCSPQSHQRYPYWSPEGTQVLFTSDRDGTYNLYLIDADGRNLRQLTHMKAPSTVYFPSWSADRKSILFGLAGEESLMCHFSLEDLVVKTIGKGRDPNISPDGSRVAYTKMMGKGYAVFVANIDGSQARQLTTHENRIGAVTPTFSPDGKSILYSDSVAGGLEIFSVGTDGGNVRQLTNLHQFATSPAWSPDQKWISFRVTDNDFWNDSHRAKVAYTEKKGDKRPVWVMRADGSEPHIVEALRYQCGIDGSRAVWNPARQGL